MSSRLLPCLLAPAGGSVALGKPWEGWPGQWAGPPASGPEVTLLCAQGPGGWGDVSSPLPWTQLPLPRAKGPQHGLLSLLAVPGGTKGMLALGPAQIPAHVQPRPLAHHGRTMRSLPEVCLALVLALQAAWTPPRKVLGQPGRHGLQTNGLCHGHCCRLSQAAPREPRGQPRSAQEPEVRGTAWP